LSSIKKSPLDSYTLGDDCGKVKAPAVVDEDEDEDEDDMFRTSL